MRKIERVQLLRPVASELCGINFNCERLASATDRDLKLSSANTNAAQMQLKCNSNATQMQYRLNTNPRASKIVNRVAFNAYLYHEPRSTAKWPNMRQQQNSRNAIQSRRLAAAGAFANAKCANLLRNNHSTYSTRLTQLAARVLSQALSASFVRDNALTDASYSTVVLRPNLQQSGRARRMQEQRAVRH